MVYSKLPDSENGFEEEITTSPDTVPLSTKLIAGASSAATVPKVTEIKNKRKKHDIKILKFI